MKSNLMIRMMIFSFMLIVAFMLGLSNADAQVPCLNLLECGCVVNSGCPNPASEIACTVIAENCGVEQFLLETSSYVDGIGQVSAVYINPAEIVEFGISHHVIISGDYTYENTLEATDDAGNMTTDGCSGLVNVPPCDIPVSVDIKPMSCPNPLNVKDRGVLSVAIVGTELDVIAIDPQTVRLEGVAPIRFSLEDVATPFDGEPGDCHALGSDGYLDLVLKFDAQEIITALGDVSDGDVLVLSLTGNLMDEYGSTPIMGEDVVVILKKGK